VIPPASGEQIQGAADAPRPAGAQHTLAHISDVHFGKVDDPRVVDAMVQAVSEAGCDLVCLSGDLTQRARRREFEAAQNLIERFGVPTLVVPGNHDVYPWWKPARRLMRPLRRFRRMITPDLTPTYNASGLAVIGLNSAYGRTIANGRLGSEARLALRAFFSGTSPDSFRVLVLHHHLLRLRALGDHDVARNARKTLALAASARVDLVLCGHLHISHVEAARVLPNGSLSTDAQGQRVVIASAGTATSIRGRGPHAGRNFFNIVRIGLDRFSVDEYDFDAGLGRFRAGQSRAFEREA
jgi:3',5'-cyclic AMP phosphodiesterase CpdA